MERRLTALHIVVLDIPGEAVRVFRSQPGGAGQAAQRRELQMVWFILFIVGTTSNRQLVRLLSYHCQDPRLLSSALPHASGNVTGAAQVTLEYRFRMYTSDRLCLRAEVTANSGRNVMDLGLHDKVIVVTGGGSGIGEAITRACLAEGARVAVLGRTSEHVEHVMQELAQAGAACELIAAELGEPQQCQSAIAQVVARHGRVDAIVNNAGENDGIGLESGTPEAFMNSLRNNLLHYYAIVHFALPALKQSRGSIINVSSKVAVTGQGGTSAYAAAKGAQLALTREWAAELLPFGIRVNAILPAEVMTPLYRRWLDTFDDPAAKLRSILRRIPLENRMTTAAEIAAAAVFLLSPTQSAHTTGQHVFVDGGYVHLDRSLD